MQIWRQFPLQLNPVNNAWPVVAYAQVFTREWLEHSGRWLGGGRKGQRAAPAAA